MVKYRDALKERVLHIGRIVLLLGLVLDVYVLKVAYGVECGESVQTAVVAAVTLYAEMAKEFIYESGSVIIGTDGVLQRSSVWEKHGTYSMGNADCGNGIDGNE